MVSGVPFYEWHGVANGACAWQRVTNRHCAWQRVTNRQSAGGRVQNTQASVEDGLWTSMCGAVRGVAWADVEDDWPSESVLDWMQSGVLLCGNKWERRCGFLSRKGHVKLVPVMAADGPGDGELPWEKKCLQLAMTRLLPSKERVRARAYFQRACANSLGSGCVASATERSNLVSVVRLLEKKKRFVWVYERTGEYAGCAWRLGAAGGTCLGALHWDSGNEHVAVGVSFGGGFVRSSFVQSSLPPPWWRSCVGGLDGRQRSSVPDRRDIFRFVPSRQG